MVRIREIRKVIMVTPLGKRFYDTNALLNLLEKAFEEEFICSYITLQEIESIKTSGKKDEETKYKARKLAKLFDKYDNYEVKITDFNNAISLLKELGLKETPDNLIMLDAMNVSKEEDVIFITDDICCKNLGRKIFGLNVLSTNDSDEKEYRGFTEVTLNEEKMAYFYSHLKDNIYDVLVNEYLIIKNELGEIVDKLVWDGEDYLPIKFGRVDSKMFGNIKPYNGDIYQQCALNCLSNNKITMLKGSAGTGKSYLAIGYLFYLLEKGKIDKIIVFCNTVATLNSAKLGFYPGSKDEKLLDSSIGNMLCAKMGGEKMILNDLLFKGKLVLLPMSDIRGYDTSGMNAGVYITEAQNMDVSLMKLALQRIGEDCVAIIDGDYNAQVDMSQYSGRNNGMRRMSEVFRGQDFYGEIELQNIYRSKVAKIAEEM